MIESMFPSIVLLNIFFKVYFIYLVVIFISSITWGLNDINKRRFPTLFLHLVLLIDAVLKIGNLSVTSCQVESAFGEFIFRELRAVAGAVTITCLMVRAFAHPSPFEFILIIGQDPLFQ